MDELEPLPEEFAQAPAAPMAEEEPAEGDDSIDLMGLLEQRMNELPDNQKEFVLANMTPETLGVLTIILGNEAGEFFTPFTDPNLMSVVQPRPADTQPVSPGQPVAPAGPSAGPMAPVAPMKASPMQMQ